MAGLNPASWSSAKFDVKAQDLQKEIMKWVSIWYATGHDFNTAHAVDLPDLVHLLEAVGFNVRCSDVTAGIAPVKNGQQGIRVSITCSHSNIRCILDKPLLEDDCKCTNAEFMLQQLPSADEKRSEILSPLPDTVSQALAFSINMLIHLMHEFETFVPTLPTTVDEIKNIKNPLIKKLHLLLWSILYSPVNVPQSQSNFTLRRCRSLDSVCIVKLPPHNHSYRERLCGRSSKDASEKVFPKPIIKVITNLTTEAMEALQTAILIVQQVSSSGRSST